MEMHRWSNKAKVFEISYFPHCNIWFRDMVPQQTGRTKDKCFPNEKFQKNTSSAMDWEKDKRVYTAATWKYRRELAAEYCSERQNGLFWTCKKAWQSRACHLRGYNWGQEGERPTKKKVESRHHRSSQHHHHRGRTAGAGPVCISRSCRWRNVPTSIRHLDDDEFEFSAE